MPNRVEDGFQPQYEQHDFCPRDECREQLDPREYRAHERDECLVLVGPGARGFCEVDCDSFQVCNEPLTGRSGHDSICSFSPGGSPANGVIRLRSYLERADETG